MKLRNKTHKPKIKIPRTGKGGFMNVDLSSYLTIIYLIGLIISVGICVFLNGESNPKTNWFILTPIVIFWPFVLIIGVVGICTILFLTFVFGDVRRAPPTLPPPPLSNTN